VNAFRVGQNFEEKVVHVAGNHTHELAHGITACKQRERNHGPRKVKCLKLEAYENKMFDKA
jgi:hypothetical protein